MIKEALIAEIQEAESRAWDALARYKFQMFGYWAAIWVHLNRVSGEKRPNPFKDLVRLARSSTAYVVGGPSAGGVLGLESSEQPPDDSRKESR